MSDPFKLDFLFSLPTTPRQPSLADQLNGGLFGLFPRSVPDLFPPRGLADALLAGPPRRQVLRLMYREQVLVEFGGVQEVVTRYKLDEGEVRQWIHQRTYLKYQHYTECLLMWVTI